MKQLAANKPLAAILLFLPLLISGCGGSGSSGSNDAPEANAGPDITARFGSEIVLSGRDSYDTDGPIMVFNWRQVSGPSVDLAALTSSSVKFTVPNASDTSELVFELSVEDNRGKTSTDRMTVTAVGPVDSDRFLTYLSTPSDYVVQVALDDGEAPLVADVDFDLVMTVTQRYQTYNGDVATRTIATETKSGTWTAQQQTDNTYPQFSFDIPSARIEDLVDVNKSTRNDIRLTLSLSLQNVTAAVDYIIQVLDSDGESIDNADIQAPLAVALNGPTPDGINIDVDLMLDNLGNDLVESQTTATAYYAAIDPDNEKTTLTDWLAANNYSADNVTRAKYLNGFDLAFGRDMRVWTNDQNHVFAVVENYPNVDSMVDGTNHVATVAMEYSPGPSGGDPFTKFYTFVRDPQTGIQQRVGSMDFDGRGEKFTPGNCAICHGGTPSALDAGVYPNEGNIDAGFLLWDVDTFAFSDGEYEGRTPEEDENVLSKSDQERAFKVFNETLLLTNIKDPQRDLIQGWYGGETLPNDTFDGAYIPEAWRSPSDGGPDTNPETASDFYLDVFAPTCRACHNGIVDTSLQFASYDDFMALEPAIVRRVFNEGSMPLARVTMDNFWVGTQSEVDAGATRAEMLAEHLVVDLDTQMPGLPVAVISAQSVNDDVTNVLPSSDEQSVSTVLRGDRINLSALASLYAETFTWSLTLPDSSATSLSVATESTSSFITDIYGDFAINLTIANEAGSESQANYIYRVENNRPVGGDFALSTKEDQAAEVNVFASPTVLGDGEDDDHAVVSVSNEVGGDAVIGVGGTIRFTPSGSGAAGFDYQIEDIDGDQSVELGSVSITVTALPSASNDNELASVRTASATRSAAFDEAGILANDTLGVEPSIILNAVSRTGGSLSNGLGSCSGVQGSMTYDSANNEFDYTPPLACVGTETYQYTIEDDNGDQSSAIITVAINRTSEGAFSNVVSAISAGSCASCHDGVDYGDGADVIDLSGSDLGRFNQLLECNTNPGSGDCGEGARINLSSPGSSLLMQKVIGNASHGGGARFTQGDTNYNRLLRWIEEGVASP